MPAIQASIFEWFLTMRSAYSIFFALLFLGNPAQATVYEFGSNGTITVHEATDYLSNSRRKHTPKASKINLTSSKKFDSLVQKAAQKYRVSPTLVHAVIQNESSYDPNAVSPKGAMGLMQLMPATAKHYLVKDAFDPEQNIFGGTKYLSELLRRYNDNIALSLAAYNAGETAVDKYNGIPPYPETEHYVAKILRIIE